MCLVLAKLEFKTQAGVFVLYMLRHARSVPQGDHVEVCALTVTMFEANLEFLIRYCSSQPKWKTSQ